MQEVQAEIVRQRFAHRYAAHAVAALVQRGRKHADAELSGQHRDDAAAHAALRRHTDPVNPFAGEVVHSARRHHAQNLVDELGAHRARAGHRIDAAVGQRRTDHREVAAVDQNRTLLEVEFERRLGVFADDPVVAQHVADCAIAVPGRAFRFEYRAIDRRARGRRMRKSRRPRVRLALRAVAPATSDEVAMAPALIIGFSGRPVPGSRLIELNASPLGSTPIAWRTRSPPRSSSATP